MILKKLISKWIWAGFFEVFYATLMTNLEKSSPESLGTPKKPAEIGRIGWIGCTSGQCGPDGGPMGAPITLGLQIRDSDLESA